VAEWSRADTGVGPAIAENSHGENGTWADFAAAASTTPPATTASQPEPELRARSENWKLPAAAKAAPAAT
jgi:hypothetical protein